MNTIVYKISNGSVIDILDEGAECNGMHKDYATCVLDIPEGTDNLVAFKDEVLAQHGDKLGRQVSEYIFGKFDPGTQMTMNNRLAIGTAAQKAKANEMVAWIVSVLQYHKAQKEAILASTTIGNGHRVEYDLSQFDDTAPIVSALDMI